MVFSMSGFWSTPVPEAGGNRLGVLLMNLGTPDAPTPRALRRYLREFLSDPRVVEAPRLPWLLLLNLIILPLRSRRSAAKYLKIWTDDGSPLKTMSSRLCESLENRLSEEFEVQVQVFLGMRYGSPSVGSVLRKMAQIGCRRILVLPLFPQYSGTTTGSCFDALSEEIRAWRRVPELQLLSSYAGHPAFIKALARSVRDSGFDPKLGRLLMSFHGLPKNYVDRGDPYDGECRLTAQALAAELGLGDGQWAMSFQSRFGRGRWLAPATDETLQRWGSEGLDNLHVICPGFPVDCLETLEEIGLEGREVFKSAGGGNYTYIPALNSRREHVQALYEVLKPFLGCHTEGPKL